MNSEHFQDLNENLFQSVENADTKSDTEPSLKVKQTDNQTITRSNNQTIRQSETGPTLKVKQTDNQDLFAKKSARTTRGQEK